MCKWILKEGCYQKFTWTAICWSVRLYFRYKRAEVTVKLKARIPPSRKSDYRVLQIGLKACHIYWKYFPSYPIVQTSITILNSSRTSANRRLLGVQGQDRKKFVLLCLVKDNSSREKPGMSNFF